MNINDYIDWRGDLSFEEREFNEVDAAILAQFVLLDLDGIVESSDVALYSVAEQFFREGRDKKSLGLLSPADANGLLRRAQESKRFQGVLLHHRINLYDEEREMQITAFTCELNKDNRLIVYSGTGDTLVAWKENLNLIVKTPTPAQEVALKYCEEQMSGYKGNIYIAGHSKGGNLAIYTSTFIDDKLKKRISKAYSFDGPGLDEEHAPLMDEKTKDILLSIHPEGSIVGKLFLHNEQVDIVKSEKEGLYQHDIFNWPIERDHFIRVNKYNEASIQIDSLVKSIIISMTQDQKKDFSDGLYKLLLKTGSKTLLEVLENRKKFLSGTAVLNEKEKKTLLEVSGKLFKDPVVRKLVLSDLIAFKKGN